MSNYGDIPIILADDDLAGGGLVIEGSYDTAFIDYLRLSQSNGHASTSSSYNSYNAFPFLEHESPRSSVWSDGLAQALSRVGDQDYNLSPIDCQDPSALSPTQHSEPQECLTPSSLISVFDAFEISSPALPSPLFQASLPMDHSDDYSAPAFSFLEPSYGSYNSSSAHLPFMDDSPTSALFGKDDSNRPNERARDSAFPLSVDTELHRSSYGPPSPFSDGSPHVRSVYSGSPSPYSPLPPSSTWSSLSHALDDSALSDVEINLEDAPSGSGHRRHSHTGVNTDVPSILSSSTVEQRPKLLKAHSGQSTQAGPMRRSARLNPSHRGGPPALPPEERGRSFREDADSAGPGNTLSRMHSPYLRPLGIVDPRLSSGGRNRSLHRVTASGQWLTVPKLQDGLLRPPSRGGHHRRHSTGDRPYEMSSSPSAQENTLLAPPAAQGQSLMLNLGYSPASEESHPLSASPVDIIPMDDYESSTAGPEAGSSPVNMDENSILPPSPGIIRKKNFHSMTVGHRVTKSSKADPAKAKVRATIASDATLKAAETRRKAQPRFVCQICKNAFTAKHNLTRHLLAHRGEKPYRCECGQSFTNKWDRTRHQKKSKLSMCKKSD